MLAAVRRAGRAWSRAAMLATCSHSIGSRGSRRRSAAPPAYADQRQNAVLLEHKLCINKRKRDHLVVLTDCCTAARQESYDWFKQYSEFRHLVLPHLKPSDRILVLGCGNSTMTADLWRDGFHDITSIDLSQVSPCADRVATLSRMTVRICYSVAQSTFGG